MALQGEECPDVPGESVETSGNETRRPQGERTTVQKRTFTRWMNHYLQRCNPPVVLNDLFADVQDGRALMVLLEELSGCKLRGYAAILCRQGDLSLQVYRFRPSTHRIFRLNNIAKALAFLDDRHVKLLGIDASSIMDGVAPVVLNLVWNMILFFQIKEVTGGLHKRLSSSLSSLSSSSCPSSGNLSPPSGDISGYSSYTLPTKGRRAAGAAKFHGKPIKVLLQWAQNSTSKFGVEVHDFGRSWRNGLAFLALIKSIDPALVDLRDGLSRQPRENLQEAFRIARSNLGIPALLEPEDVACSSPDERSIITYVSMFLEHHSDADEDFVTDVEMRVSFPDIPNFASSETVSVGNTLVHHPEAQAFLQGQDGTKEQMLWRRWARRSSGELPKHRQLSSTVSWSSSKNMSSSHSPQSGSKRTLAEVFSSTPNKQTVGPRGQDLCHVGQDAWTWTSKTTEEQVYGLHEAHLSQSSEEGMYSLSLLDSDEEDAYSYILDLHRDSLHSHHPPNASAHGDKEFKSGSRASNRHLQEEANFSISEILRKDGHDCHPQTKQNLPLQNASEDREAHSRNTNLNRKESFTEAQQRKKTNRLRKTTVMGTARYGTMVEIGVRDEGEKESFEKRQRVGREQNKDAGDVEEEKEEEGGGVRLVKEEPRREGVREESKSEESSWVLGSNFIRNEEDDEKKAKTKRENGVMDRIDEEEGEDEGHAMCPGWVKVMKLDDEVFGQRVVRTAEEISEFRERFGFGGRSSVNSVNGRYQVEDAEISAPVGCVRKSEGEVDGEVFGGLVGKASERDENKELTCGVKRQGIAEWASVVKTSPFKNEKQQVGANQVSLETTASKDNAKEEENKRDDGVQTGDDATGNEGDEEGLPEDWRDEEEEQTNYNEAIKVKDYGKAITLRRMEEKDRRRRRRGNSLMEEKEAMTVSDLCSDDKLLSDLACCAAVSSEEVAPPPPLKASSDGTPLELLLVLWILLYCFLLLRQMEL